jgi:hypothetical protein
MAFGAMSYAWGCDFKYISLLLCQGGASCFLATAKVDCLFHHIRRPTEYKRLWIDSICLNQVDDEEKSAQVARMADILLDGQSVGISRNRLCCNDKIFPLKNHPIPRKKLWVGSS